MGFSSLQKWNLVCSDLLPQERDVDDGESAVVLDEGQSSTASVASSILRYRMIQGRTYHSERHDTDYWTPNDEQQSDSIDLS